MDSMIRRKEGVAMRSATIYRRGHLILFCQRTSLHGLADIYRSKNRTIQIMWLLLFVGALAAAIYMWYSILAVYRAAPIVASYFIKGTEMTFALPDLVICPFNRFNAEFLHEHNVSNDVAQYMQLAFGATAKHPAQRRDLMKFLNGKRMRQLDAEMNTMLDSMNMTYADFLEAASLKCEDILADCILPDGVGRCCDRASDMLTFAGKCYRIQGIDQAGVGYGYGITITIVLPKKKYSLSVNNWLNDGVVVKLAERNQGVDYDLTFVPVGTHALMPLKAVKYEFIDDPPRFDCLANTAENYSRVQCFDSCITESAEQHCHCTIVTKFDKRTGQAACTTIQYYYCIFNYLRQRLVDEKSREEFFFGCRQRCKPRCEYWQYHSSISYSDFPTAQAFAFAESEQERNEMKNTILLDVYFEKLEYTLVKHYRAMSIHGFIANLGGHYSLWLGGSVITLVQLFVFLSRYFSSFCFGACLFKGK